MIFLVRARIKKNSTYLSFTVLLAVCSTQVMYEVIRRTIRNATTFDDLVAISRELLPLEDLQSILLNRLDHVKEVKDPKTSIRSVYLKSSSFHEVFPEVIQFKIVSFLNETNMFKSIPCISHSFSQLFVNFPSLLNEVSLPFLFSPSPDPLALSHSQKKVFGNYPRRRFAFAKVQSNIRRHTFRSIPSNIHKSF